MTIVDQVLLPELGTAARSTYRELYPTSEETQPTQPTKEVRAKGWKRTVSRINVRNGLSEYEPRLAALHEGMEAQLFAPAPCRDDALRSVSDAEPGRRRLASRPGHHKKSQDRPSFDRLAPSTDWQCLSDKFAA